MGLEPWDPNKYVNSDAPSVDPKYKNVTLNRPKPKLEGAAGVAVGIFNAGCMAFGGLTEGFFAGHVDKKYKKQVQFPLTQNNIGYTAANILVAPAVLADQLKKDPGNEELWGQAALFVMPFLKVKPRTVIVSAPESIEFAMSKYTGPLPSLSRGNEGVTFRSVSNVEVKEFISTEPGAQGPKALSQIQNKINTNDWSVWVDPIYTTTYKGSTYILDGNNRLKVVSQSTNSMKVSTQELSIEQARKIFPDKMKDIEAGKFNKKISDND